MSKTPQQLKDECQSWLVGRSFPNDQFFLDLLNEVSTHCNVGLKDVSGNWVVPPLRVHEMETSDDLVGTDGVFTLPADFLEAISIRDNTGKALEFVSRHDRMGVLLGNEYTVIGNTLKTIPTVSELELVYFAKVDNTIMDMENGTNILLQEYPHVLRHGILALTYSWEGRDQGQGRAATEMTLCGQSVAALNLSTKLRRTRGNTLRSR